MGSTKKVMGVDMTLVKEQHVNAALARHELRVGNDDLPSRVIRLVNYYRAETPKARLVDCLNCHGVSDVKLTVCPYCGDGEVDENSSPTSPLAPTEAGIVPAASAVVLSERDLDKAVGRVQKLKQASASSVWDLGCEIRRIYDSGLWKQRRDPKGAPKWKSWSQFIEGELGISPAYGHKLMDVALAFSKQQVEEIGVKKLHLTLQVPKEAREKLVQAAGSTSASQLAEQVKKEKERLPKANTKRDTGRKKTGAAAHKPGAKAGGRKAEKVTVAALVGRVELPLMKGTTDKPARSLNDVPRATERLLNGVTQVFVISKDEATGQWILIVERTRE